MWSEPSEVIGKGALPSCLPSEMSVRDTSRKSDVICTPVREVGPTQLCVLPESPSGEPCSPHTSCLGKPAGSYQEFSELGSQQLLQACSQHGGLSHVCVGCAPAPGSLGLVLSLGPALGGSASQVLEPTTFFLGSVWWSCHLYLAPLFSASGLVCFALSFLHWVGGGDGKELSQEKG